MDRFSFARQLRHDPTPAEARLWSMLRARRLGHRFRRQEPRGPYVLDFVCLEKRLVVEADGGQHAEPGADAIRDAWLAARGFRVLRFWNHEILRNPEGVRIMIARALEEPPLPVTPR